jgi:hypothetical protein
MKDRRTSSYYSGCEILGKKRKNEKILVILKIIPNFVANYANLKHVF